MSYPVHAIVDYEDPYVQPLIIDALRSQLGDGCGVHTSFKTVPTEARIIQIRAYEAIDFEYGTTEPDSLFNAYVIRKALIRKHYLSNTVHSWTAKNSTSTLRQHFMQAEDFELDYAEFLDDALVEAFDLRASFESNAEKDSSERQWWILKPSMSDRGQGIRLFSTEEELLSIFENWEAQNPDDGGEDEDGHEEESEEQVVTSDPKYDDGDYIVTSHLRHFVAQPYIHPPLLITDTPFDNRKFHIRTYVVAAGALRVYVYQHMLALFASEPYTPPWSLEAGGDSELGEEMDLLQRMQNVHLTNTCVQRGTGKDDTDERNVFLLSKLPLSAGLYASIITQINDTTSELFRAAAAQPTNFQALPQAFEVFGLDFLVDEAKNVWLLEVNAFPDFAQTGKELKETVVKGLWEDIANMVIAPHFGLGDIREGARGGRIQKVLDMDMGRR